MQGKAGSSGRVDTSPAVADQVRYTTCYMCACRCGIKVHLKDGQIRYIQGNRDHPVNKGVLCAKGSAGIMQHYSPARLKKPLKRVGERGGGEFGEIEWDEALEIARGWLAPIRESDPRKLAFFTGRDQSQALTGWWASQFGTPNYAAHGGFCSVNMAAGGLYSIGGSFWEFGEPDWEHSESNYLLREMAFKIARKHARKLRALAVLLCLLAPTALGALVMLAGGWVDIAAVLLAAGCGTLGVIVERWLFFAEAKHTVTLYYGARTA